MDGIRQTTYLWAGWSFVLLGVVSVYGTVAYNRDMTSLLLTLPFSLLPLILGVLFIRRSRSL